MTAQSSQVASLLLRAVVFAAEKHRRQRRKDAESTPYVNHVVAVANVIALSIPDADQAVLIAAILHDTIEDTSTTHAELATEFGVEVATLVLEVTDDKSLGKAERKQRQIEHASHLSLGAKIIKLADKTCNLRDLKLTPPADWRLDRKREYFEWAKAVVDELRGASPPLERLFDIEYSEKP